MIIYKQKDFTCQQYVIFWIIGHNFGQWLPQRSVDKWIAKNNLKNPKQRGGLSSIEAAEYIAKEIGRKVVTFGFRDSDFMKWWKEGKAIWIPLKVEGGFYRDTMDGRLDSYFHKRGEGVHGVYIYNGGEKGILVNSVGSLIPPCEFDLEEFKESWLSNLLCFTII